MDIRDKWRLDDIESHITRLESQMHEVHAIRSTLDCMERTMQNLSTSVDGLWSELQVQENRLNQQEEMIHAKEDRKDD